MGSKFFVYGDGRWRELDVHSGTLAGWGRVAFVYQAGGRLALAQRRCVLRALRALAAGRGRAARDGLQLSKHTPYPEHGMRHRLDSPQPRRRRRSHHAHAHALQTCTKCDNNAKFERLREPQCTVGVQCVSTVEAAVQVSRGDRVAEGARGRTSDGMQEVNSSQSSFLLPRNKRGQFVNKRSNCAKYSGHDKSFPMTGSGKIKLITEKGKPSSPASVGESDDSESPKTKSVDSHSSKYTNKADVELMINEADVELLLRFLEKNNLGVDLERFVNEEQYKAKVLYALNPLVLVERSARIGRMLRDERGAAARLSLKSFMSMLGLQTVGQRGASRGASRGRYSTRARAARRGKENAARRGNEQRPAEVIEVRGSSSSSSSSSGDSSERHVVDTWQRGAGNGKRKHGTDDAKLQCRTDDGKRQRRTDDGKRQRGIEDGKQQRGTVDGKRQRETDDGKQLHPVVDGVRTSKSDDRKRPVVRDVGSGGSGGGSKKNREYSVQEDSAIVSWLRQGGRARLVKGNRLWRELQQEHAARTGIVRSWHSLRNRYLRNILPMLPRLTSQQEAMRLRAAASAGELKSRKQSRENSMLALPPVRSAWTRRQVVAPSDSPATSPAASPAASPATSPEPAPRASTPKPTERTRPAPARSPTYSEVTRRFGRARASEEEEESGRAPPAAERSLRLRPRASPAAPPPPPRTLRAAPAKRRLYNPKVAA